MPELQEAPSPGHLEETGSSSLVESAVRQPSPEGTSITGTKRKHAEDSDEYETKRTRVSPVGDSAQPHTQEALKISTPKQTTEQKALVHEPEQVASAIQRSANGDDKVTPRRKPGAVDEKQRSRRLFGSLLGTLGQRGDTTGRKRQEIEARTKAELQQQDDVLSEDRSLRQQRLKERRIQEQWHVDETDVCDNTALSTNANKHR